MVEVDEDILNFLRAVYFGGSRDLFIASCKRAYRDMNRTIRFAGLAQEKRASLRSKATELLVKRIKNINVVTQEDFDRWHRNLCEELKNIYLHEGIVFTVGQAQKWVNMTFKYLYIIGAEEFEDIFPLLHIPLDNYVFDIAEKVLNIERPKIAWSKWDDYDEQYLLYQKALRSCIKIDPLRWEFRYWLKEARQVEIVDKN